MKEFQRIENESIADHDHDAERFPHLRVVNNDVAGELVMRDLKDALARISAMSPTDVEELAVLMNHRKK